ncbi:MAG: Do family serine endopeptidase [Proteobacteria bacterium]|nr:Do family serine endopeptidase [Pseudomonadota bacterium]
MKLSLRHFSLISLFAGALLAAANTGLAVSAEALARGIPSLAPMLEQVTPAVVNIRVSKAIPTSSRYFFQGDELPEELRRFFPDRFNQQEGRRQPYAVGAGSGVIVDAEQGFIITNHHVVEGATSINVQLHDGRTMEAELIGSDESTDVALIQIVAEELTDIEMADIDTVQVGDYVVAIGNPFGIGQTVTSGIVSALGRTGLNNNNYEDFIQTDAAINVGNSGGALVDLEGRLIGINTAIISGNGGNNGIGFAVPVDMMKAVMTHLERDGEVRRGVLGVTIASLTPDAREALGVDLERGALVTSVLENSAAERAGIQVSDIITEFNGEPVTGSRELRNMVGLLGRDVAAEIKLQRGDESLSVTAIIGDGEGVAVAEGGSTSSGQFRGAQLRNSQDVEGDLEPGVYVEFVNPQGRAYGAGLRDGDLIVEVNRRAVSNVNEFNEVVQDGGRFAALTVIREDRRVLLLVP